MPSPTLIWTAALLIAALAFGIHSSNESTRKAPSTGVPLARSLAADLEDGKLDAFSLLEAAAIAGGVTDRKDLNELRHQYEAKCAAYRSLSGLSSSDDARAHELLRFLHDEILAGNYRADYSQVDRALRDGHFNCVTSTILYKCLCDKLGLKIDAISSKSHVLCRVPQSGTYIETTCPECYAGESGIEQSRGSLLHEPRVLTDEALLGKVYYNLGLEQIEKGTYSEAIHNLQIARRLDPSDSAAHQNYLAALNNWALAECDAGHFEVAGRLIEQGLAADSTYAPLQVNDVHVHQKRVQQLCAAGHFPEAIELAEQVRQRRPDVPLFENACRVISGMWAESRFIAGDIAGGWSVLDQLRLRMAAPSLGIRELNDWQIGIVLNASSVLVERGEYRLAEEILASALARHPTNSQLRQRKSDLPSTGM